MDNIVNFPSRPDMDDYRAREESHLLSQWFAAPINWQQIATHNEEQCMRLHEALKVEREKHLAELKVANNTIENAFRDARYWRQQAQKRNLLHRITHIFRGGK